MITQDVKNNTKTNLNVGGVNIAPGETKPVPNWEKCRSSKAVKVWQDKEIITLGDVSGEVEYDTFIAEQAKATADADVARAEEAKAKADANLELARKAAETETETATTATRRRRRSSTKTE